MVVKVINLNQGNILQPRKGSQVFGVGKAATNFAFRHNVSLNVTSLILVSNLPHHGFHQVGLLCAVA